MKKQLLASIGAILFSASVAFGQNCANDVTAPTPGDASGNAASVQTTYTSQNPLEIQLGSTGTAGFGVDRVNMTLPMKPVHSFSCLLQTLLLETN